MSPIATSIRLVTTSPPFPVVVAIVVVAFLSVALAAYTVWHEAYAAPQAVDDEEAKAVELIVVASRHAFEFENVDNHSSIKRYSRAMMSPDSAYTASTFRASSVHVNGDPRLQGLYAHSPSPSSIPSASTVFSTFANSSPVRIEPFPQDSEEDELDITNAGASFGPGTYSLFAYEGSRSCSAYSKPRVHPTAAAVCDRRGVQR
ncbi:hypothetical protein EXIGLDRAFT_776488 [Exidia glandulosa HHB12029]|uniref:Transmembrane protein n=1 Tax=Exidia glandulosa HHB12029 TaxID=1314781 RepID=A0A165DG36_EXIGL|nr:hypothetical protein EXIGLDRAFT_776488 [Exidia glandulosa HHB12029]